MTTECTLFHLAIVCAVIVADHEIAVWIERIIDLFEVSCLFSEVCAIIELIDARFVKLLDAIPVVATTFECGRQQITDLLACDLMRDLHFEVSAHALSAS